MIFTKEEQEWYDRQRAKQTKKTVYDMSKLPTLKEIRDHKRQIREINKLPKDYRKYLQSANARRIVFELTIEQFNSVVSKPCTYCGNPPNNGIDRFDNSIGYILSNCQPCCGMCNMAKYKYTHDQFINHIKKIANHQGF